MQLQGRNLSFGMEGEDVALLHSELHQLGYEISAGEIEGKIFDDSTADAVKDLQNKHDWRPPPDFDEAELRALVDKETARLINAEVDAASFTVEGKVTSRSRAGVDGLKVHIVDKNCGEDVVLKHEPTKTDENGAYRVAFAMADLRRGRGKERPDLQARVFRGDKFLGASEVRYNASEHETLNVLLTDEAASALPSEHESLVDVLAANCQHSLRDLQETDDRQDITYLANKTGWDARAVALAALGDQFSARARDAEGNASIEPALFYALFRAGLPANEAALYQTDPKSAEAIWKQAIEQGVIPAGLEDGLPAAVERFQELAAQHVLDAPALVGVSSLKEILSVSLGEDPDPQRQKEKEEQFAGLYTRHRGDLPTFWQAVRDAFGEPAEKRLKLDGQLAYLTLNNAPLIRKLHRKLHEAGGQDGLTDALNLVEEGYHRAEKWQEVIGNDPIPPEIFVEDDPDTRSRYAELLAAQVRLSFPTAVVAHMVKSGDTPLADGLADPVHGFLTEQLGKFEIGMQPVEQYVVRNNLDVAPEVTKEVTRIQRVYQITPSGDAMNVLMNKGLDSAYHVVRYSQDEFVRAFKDDLGGEENARLTYAKAQQVHNAVLNIASSYLIASTAPAIGVHSPAHNVDPKPQGPAPDANAGDVIAYPTLEKLFGEMDYCGCEHCRSWLSPAAYLVDLLQFIDLKRYNSEGEELVPRTYEKENPQDVLFGRRPDIQHLPLTCENTNLPLPYIDLVNETLEYFIANDTKDLSLENYQAHSTDGGATPEELLASPQSVHDKAYEVLARLPAQPGDPPPLPQPMPPTPPLPFHQPLENLRRYFDRFETPLPEVMKALRKSDDLERPAPADPENPVEYGWRDILMEELRLSRAEYALLTDGTLTLQQLYGYPPSISDPDVVARLSNAKDFTRRVGISYEDIIEILKTRFVNPHSTLIPQLERLGVPFVTLKKFKDGAMSDADFEAALASHLDASKYDGDIKAWVKNGENYANIMGLITVTNPIPELIRKLEEAGIPLATLKALQEGAISDAQFDALLPPDLDVSRYDGDVKRWVRENLDEADDACSFDKLKFSYADPAKIGKSVRAFEFKRLIRFIRLWKKLGWTIEQTDKAITALYPVDQIPNTTDDAVDLQRLDAGFLTLLPRLGVIKQVMGHLKLTPKKDLLSLLACFAPMDTHGAASLYRQMFLSPALLKLDPVFADDGYGNFLTDQNEKLRDHAEALRAAFQLTDAELSEITVALRYDDNTPIEHVPTTETLTGLLAHAPSDEERDALSEYYRPENISAIFRWGWLARKLKMSVRELLLLTQFTGIDPFAPPDPPNPPDRAAPPPILRFVELVDRLRAASLKPAEALYLIWNQDISGKSVPDEKEILNFVRALRVDFAAIESEFTLVDDPDGQIARAKMALVYGSEATDLFFGLLEGKVITDVPYSQPQATLKKAILDAASGHIGYDDFRKRLSYNAGVIPDATRDALISVPGATQKFKTAVDELYKNSRAFFDRYPELLPLHDAFIASNDKVVPYSHDQATLDKPISDAAGGRISYDDHLKQLSYRGEFTADIRDALKAVAGVPSKFKTAVNKLFAQYQSAEKGYLAPYPKARHPKLSALYNEMIAAGSVPGKRYSVVLESLLPELKRRRKRQQALQVMSAAAQTEAGFASALLDDAGVLHAAGNNAVAASVGPTTLPPALDDLTALEMAGLSATFFFRNTATGAKDRIRYTESNLGYTATGSNKLPANGNKPISGVWSGYLEAPENGFYNFRIEADASAKVELVLDGKAIIDDSARDGNVWSNKGPIELRAGTLNRIDLTVEKVKNTLKVGWESTGRGWEVIPPRYLYSATLTDHFRATYVRFFKVVSLATALKLTANEIVHFASTADYFIGGQGWLNSLAVAGSPDNATSSALLKAFNALLDFSRIKTELAPGDERLLTVLKDPEAAAKAPAENTDPLLFTLTRWESASLSALLARFGKVIADLAQVETFHRVYAAHALVKKMGIPAAALITSATNEPKATTVRDLQAALRARYDESDWLNVLKPINDEMRGLQRDALVAYILHQMRENPDTAHLDTPDKLFEYFLMDVQMDACMQTSRIRHALSTVQLFIERCLMNLEQHVAPSSINAKHWEWMKRYRVWEANRKVFLWPENWLEPELRDDQSPFFKETMSELLQSDITEDSAATTMLNYLSKLEEVAKLEPCGIHYVENEPGTSDDVAHVVARTAGASRKYFYRRREGGSWTPWEQIKLDIEDNPVIPAVWKGRLFLFWLRILKQAPLDSPAPPPGDNLAAIKPSDIVPKEAPKVTVQAVLCYSEYYNGKWQPTKTSDINRPTTLTSQPVAGATEFDRSILDLSVSYEQGALRVKVHVSSFLLYNTHSLPVRQEDVGAPNDVFLPSRIIYPISLMPYTHPTPSMPFPNTFFIDYAVGEDPDDNIVRDVLSSPFGGRGIQSRHPLQNPRQAPFFFEDSHHVFYVSTTQQSVTVPQFDDYGAGADSSTHKLDIPPLLWDETFTIPDLLGPVATNPHVGVVNAAQVQRFVSEDAYIKRGIAMSGTVQFGEKQIGPAGSRAIDFRK